MRSRFRMFAGEREPRPSVGAPVSVKLGDVTDILADAYRSDRTWLMDFANDEIQMSQDLYEVLSAYWRTRPAA